MLIELLLAVGEFATPDVLGAEVGGQRVDGEQADGELLVLALACDFLGLLGQENLVVGVERLRDVDLLQHGGDEVIEQVLIGRVCVVPLLNDAVEDHRVCQYLVGEALDHLFDTLRSERVLGVDEDGAAFQSAVFGR